MINSEKDDLLLKKYEEKYGKEYIERQKQKISGLSEGAKSYDSSSNDIMRQFEEAKEGMSVLSSSAETGFSKGVHGQKQFYNQYVLGENETQESKDYAEMLAEKTKYNESLDPYNAFFGDVIGETGSLLWTGGLQLGKKTLPGRASTAAAQGAIVGGLQYVPEDGSRATNVAVGTLSSLIPFGIVESLAKSMPSLSKMGFGTELSPEELKKNLKASEGSETNLGRVIENSFLSKIYEMMTVIPGSGVEGQLKRTGQFAQEKGSDIVESYGGRSPNFNTNVNSDLQFNMIDNAFKLKAKENKAYEDLYKVTDNKGTYVDTRELSRAAEPIEKYLENPKLDVIYKKYSDDINRASGEAEIPFRDADKLRSHFLSQKSQAVSSGDKTAKGLYSQFNKALFEDVNRAAKEAGPEVKGAWDYARFIKKNVTSPVLENKKIQQVIGKDIGVTDITASQGLVDKIIQPGKGKDQVETLELYKELLDKKGIEDLIYGYFNKATGMDNQINPQKLAQLMDNLGPGQIESLGLSPSQMELFKSLVKMNTKSFDLMANPETGVKAMQTGILGSLMAAGYGALGWAGAAGAIPAAAGLSNALAKQLTDESFRRSYVEKLLNPNGKGYSKEFADILLQISRPATASSLIGNEVKIRSRFDNEESEGISQRGAALK